MKSVAYLLTVQNSPTRSIVSVAVVSIGGWLGSM